MNEWGADSVTGPDPSGDMSGSVFLDQVGDEVVVLRVSGALDLALVPMLRRVVERVIRLRPRIAVFDLTKAEFLASVGMAELLRAKAQLAERGSLRLVAADRVVLRPLILTRLIDEFDIYPTLEDAMVGR